MFGTVLRSTKRLQFTFLLLTVALAFTVVLLGRRLGTQDQQLFEKQLDDEREAAAGIAVIALEQRIVSVERVLTKILADNGNEKPAPASDSVFFRFVADSVQSWPADGLVYLPSAREAVEAPETLFAAADEAEIQQHNTAGAINLLSSLAASKDPKVRAAALVRIAGNQRASGQFKEAIETYNRLAELGAVSVGGLPAALSARVGALTVYEQQKARESLIASARGLEKDLRSGLWPISFEVYQSLSDEVRRVLPESMAIPSPRESLSEGVLWVWDITTRENGKGRGVLNVYLMRKLNQLPAQLLDVIRDPLGAAIADLIDQRRNKGAGEVGDSEIADADPFDAGLDDLAFDHTHDFVTAALGLQMLLVERLDEFLDRRRVYLPRDLGLDLALGINAALNLLAHRVALFARLLER